MSLFVVCTHCPNGYTRKSSMETHFILTHQPEAAPYKCAVCGRPFVNRSMFMSHKNMHITVNRYTKILIKHHPHWLKYLHITSDNLKNNLETVFRKSFTSALNVTRRLDTGRIWENRRPPSMPLVSSSRVTCVEKQ